MIKYNYTNPIMKQVAELCDNGHYPICKSEYGEYAIFSPFRDDEGYIKRTYWYGYANTPEGRFLDTYQDNDTYQPTEIIGFYHPPLKKFKVGDKVRVREDLKELYTDAEWNNYTINFKNTIDLIGVIKKRYDGSDYMVYFESLEDEYLYIAEQLEPAIEKQKPVTEKQNPDIIELNGKKYKLIEND